MNFCHSTNQDQDRGFHCTPGECPSHRLGGFCMRRFAGPKHLWSEHLSQAGRVSRAISVPLPRPGTGGLRVPLHHCGRRGVRSPLHHSMALAASLLFQRRVIRGGPQSWERDSRCPQTACIVVALPPKSMFPHTFARYSATSKSGPVVLPVQRQLRGVVACGS